MIKNLKLKQCLNRKNVTIAAGFLGLFLFVTGLSLLVFTLLGKGSSKIANVINGSKSRLNVDLPKTESCPINGGLYTKPEREVWDTRRPIAIMIENHAESRPPSGLSKADVVYEALAEGGITRYLAILYCGVAFGDVQIAPVRSSRSYFIDWASEYGDYPIYMHVGGANDFSGLGDTAPDVRALEILANIGWRVPSGNDFDTTYDSGFPVFWRNYERLGHEVATEHTMMVSTDAAYKDAEKRGLGAKDSKGVSWDKNYIAWKFVNESPSSSPQATDIKFGFWDNKPDYDVEWKYDTTKNLYLRQDGGQPHTDLEYNNVQLNAKNVVVQLTKESDTIDKNFHTFYQTIGSGKVMVFQNGNVIVGTWKKESRIDRTRFYDDNGREISFVRGPIWLEIVPAGNTINY